MQATAISSHNLIRILVDIDIGFFGFLSSSVAGQGAEKYHGNGKDHQRYEEDHKHDNNGNQGRSGEGSF